MERFQLFFKALMMLTLSAWATKPKDVLILNSIGHSITRITLGSDMIKTTPVAPNHRCLSPNHLTQFGHFYYVTCSLSDAIILLEPTTLGPVRAIDLKKSTNPMETTVLSANLAAATSFNKNSVIFFDPRPEAMDSEKRILKTIPLSSHSPDVSARPSGMALADDKLFVALANLHEDYSPAPSAQVAVFQANTGEIVKIINLSGRNATHMRAFPNIPGLESLLFVIQTGDYGKTNSEGSGKLSIVNLNTLEVDSEIDLGQAPTQMDVSSDGIAYFSNGMGQTIGRYDLIHKKSLSPLTFSLKECRVNSPTDFRYVPAVKVVEDELWALEFTSQCFVRMKRETGEVIKEFKTGEGPVFFRVQ